MSFNVTLEGAAGMTHDAVGAITKTIEQRGIQMRDVKTLIVEQKHGTVGIVFRDGREAVMTDVFDPPGGKRKIFLPGAR